MSLDTQKNVRLSEEQLRYLERLIPTIPPSERERPRFEATVSDAMRLVIDRARMQEPRQPECPHTTRLYTTVGDESVEEKCRGCHRLLRWWSRAEWAARGEAALEDAK